jgi:hypothetical protein
MTRRIAVVFALITLMSAVLTGAAMAGNSNGAKGANWKLCLKGGWETLYTSNGEPFASQKDCVSYAKQGGTLFTSQTQAVCQFYGGTFSTDPATDLVGPGGTFVWSCNGIPPFSLRGAQILTLNGLCTQDGGNILAATSDGSDFTCAKL